MIHPIEAESYRILAARVDLSRWPEGPRAVIARVVHASADVEFAETMVMDEAAVAAGVAALRAGAPIVADVEMTRAAITGGSARCYLGEVLVAPSGLTRSAAGMRLAAARHPEGAIFAVGCAPTALVELLSLTAEGECSPALVVGLPVGFVGAAEAKEALRRSGLPAVTNRGEKGGSAVAGAAVNALARLAHASAGGWGGRL